VIDRTKVTYRLLTYRKCIAHAFSDEIKSSILDDLEGKYCNRKCIGCSASFLATVRLSCYFMTCGVLLHSSS